MKKFILIVCIMLLATTMLVGCGKTQTIEESTDVLALDWEEVVKESKGKIVNIHMWGGDDLVNRYMDEWVAPRLKESYDIELNRVPINDAKDMINKLLTEKEVDRTKGSIDIFWINGENFKISKENNLLWGSFADKLPNYNTYVDKDVLDLKYDFGEETKGMEAPWGKAQFVFIYDESKIKNPPKSMEVLKEWVKENPGKFTYPAPPDFTGSAFIRHGLFETTGGYKKYLKKLNQEEFKNEASPLWNYLNEIKPYLWREGKTYPESIAKLDRLYENGEVWMSLSYNPVHAASKIEMGQFPQNTKTFVLDQGTLANTHYLSIPFNATQKAGAMVVINFLLSPEAQMKKFDPKYWGDGSVLSYDKLSEKDQKSFDQVDRGGATLSQEVLEKNRIPEISAEYVHEIEKGWMENVVKK
ncbi:MAG: ABC transporter substrate-binding protein [Marinisporobacter sp.]|jgi:putative spermidine/putrescine transport system substrate-binding protein|nr:ABC transporter substrate-binding protein [Marinisporobacter sp.]